MENKCKNCGCNFKEWICTAECDECEDGLTESNRPFWDGSGLVMCKKCNGSSEIKTNRLDFCSGDCIDEYMDDLNQFIRIK